MDQPVFEFKLSPKEIETWRDIQAMESTHNELGAALSAYRDSIMKYRNDFVGFLTKKYGLKNPAHVTIDPVTKSVISVFSPNLQARIITVKDQTFKQAAFNGMVGLIGQIKSLYVELLRERMK